MERSLGIIMQIMSVLLYMLGMVISEIDINLKQVMLKVDKLTDAVSTLNDSIRILDESFLGEFAHFTEQMNAIKANQLNMRKSLLADWIEIAQYKVKLKIFPSKLNAYKAEETCKSFAAKLLTINDVDFNKEVSDILRREVDEPAWIGPRTYFDITELRGYRNFDSTELNVGCVALSPDGTWLSRNCDETKHFICAIGNLQ